MNRPRASTTATRRYRVNQENRDRENRARIMGRIGEGARPRQSTLQKYNILPAEVDAARAAVSLPPLYKDNNYQSTTTLQNTNEATQREIDEVAKQQRLIVDVFVICPLAVRRAFFARSNSSSHLDIIHANNPCSLIFINSLHASHRTLLFRSVINLVITEQLLNLPPVPIRNVARVDVRIL